MIPVAAIQRGQQGTFVYTVDDASKVKVQVITLGPGDGSRNAVLKGLEPGQRVVVDGADRLKEGMTVETVDPAARAAATVPASQPRGRGRRNRDGAGGGGASAPHGAASGAAAGGASGVAGEQRRHREGGASAPGAEGPRREPQQRQQRQQQ
ncbi:Multidrug resistance protein MdtA precursor [compost metagenome]